MRRVVLPIVGVLVASLSAAPAGAQYLCESRSDLIGRLDKIYREAPIALGLMPNGQVLEVLTSANGTWTVIISKPNGLSCAMAAGEAWSERDRPVSYESGT